MQYYFQERERDRERERSHTHGEKYRKRESRLDIRTCGAVLFHPGYGDDIRELVYKFPREREITVLCIGLISYCKKHFLAQ